MANYFLNGDGSLSTKNKKKKGNNYIIGKDGTISINTTQEDIAPVKKQEEKDTWFSKGAFSDGYDFGDVTKTILGTVGDVGVGATKGIVRIGEGLGDLASYGVAGVADLLGHDDYADRVRKNTSESLTDQWFKPVEDFVDPYSVIGEKGDSISEGLGYVGAILATGGVAGAAGLGTLGTTVATSALTGLSSMGSGMSEAYQGGATDEEALMYGIISGVAEAGSELIFGGLGKAVNAVGLSKGLSGLDDAFAKKISSKLTSQLSKNLAEYTVKAGAEGVEEVISGIATGIGKKLTYMSDEDLLQIIKDEKLLDQFISGAVVSGISQTSGLVKTTKADRDFISGYTQNEQKVVDAEVENRVNEQQARTGKELTNKEISKIREEVENDFQKGYVSTDTIENTLGRKLTAEQEADIETQLNTLLQQSKTATDPEQIAQIEQQIDMLGEQLETSQKLDFSKDAYIQKSYQEKALRSENYTYEATDNDKVNKLRESATKYLNNTTRSHELVDTLAKISKDTKTQYEFINTEGLKEAGYNLEGKTVNGLVTKDGKVLINIDSKNVLEKIIGHETTHLLEGTQEYQALQDTAIEYAKTKGIYNDRITNLKSLYKGTKADINAELTSDLVGELLFTDEAFIEHLSAKQPNVFQRVYNYIKHVYKMATAGSKEARQLEELKYKFEKAYKKAGTQTTDTKYSMNEKAVQGLENYSRDEIKQKVTDYINTELEIYDNYSYGLGKEAEIVGLEIIGSRNRGNAKKRSDLDIVVEFKGDSLREDSLFNALNDYKRQLKIDGIRVDINPIVSHESGTLAEYMESSNAYDKEILSKQSTTDNQGRTLTKEQQEYFKDSKVRDENGNLLTVYHGSKTAGFTVFDGSQGQGNYKFGKNKVTFFTESERVANSYIPTKDTGGIYEGYLNLKNPLIIDADGSYWNTIDYYGDGSLLATTNEIVQDALNGGEYDADGNWIPYDGVIFKNIVDVGGSLKSDYSYKDLMSVARNVYVSFNPNQFKNVDNTNPTSDPDIRYSLSEDGKMVDSKGNEVKLEAAEAGTHGTLMAIHNLTADKLKGVLELGGFPVPSIAITNPSIINHGGFGDISVIFDKDTINPADYRNEVYDRDVWSPRFPQVNYDINSENIKRYIGEMHNYNYANKDSIIDQAVLRYMYQENLSQMVNSEGKDKVLERIKTSPEMQYLWKTQVEKGQYSPKMQDLKYNDYYSNESLQNFIDNFEGDMSLEDFYYHYMNYRDMQLSEEQNKNLKDQVLKAITPEVEQDINNTLKDKQLDSETKEKYRKELFKAETSWIYNNYFRLQNFIGNAVGLQKNGNRQVVDVESTLNDISNQIDQNEYEQWVDNTYGKMFENTKKGIRNDKDVFTPSGNRRSFDKLHNEYNLRNIVDYITKKDTKGSEGGFVAGGFGEIQAKRGNKFDSIQDIKNSESKIVDEQLAHETLEPLKTAIYDDIQELSNYYNTSGYTYGSWDSAANAISEFAGKKNLTEASLKRVLQSYYNFEVDNIPKGLLQKIIKDLKALDNIQTDYFEAKPQRAVGFDEVEAIVVPNDMNVELKQQLYDRGLNVVEYDSKIEGDRQAKINEFDELKFSLSAENEIAPIGQRGTYGKDVRLEVEEAIAPLQETISNLTEQVKTMQESFAPTSQDIVEQQRQENFEHLPESEMPTEIDETEFAPIEDTYEDVSSPVQERDMKEVGNRKIKAYQYEHPEVRPYFQVEADNMLGELSRRIEGERYPITGEDGYTVEWTGISRSIPEDIAYLKDNYGYTYEQIEKGLKAIIEDNGAENNAVSKRLEILIDERLTNGYVDFLEGYPIPANQEYKNMLIENDAADYYSNLAKTLDDADIAPEQATMDVEPEIETTEQVIPQQEEITQNGNTSVENIDNEIRALHKTVQSNPNLSEAELIDLMNKLEELSNKRKNVMNPLEISKLTPEDASTTPQLSKRRVAKGNKLSSFYKNATETTQMLSKEAREYISKNDNVKFYQGITNDQSLAEAYDKLQKGGTAETVKWLKKDAKAATATDIAEGWILLKQYQDAGDYDSMVEIAKKMREMGTAAGQTVQAFNIMSRLTPEGMVKYAQSELSEAYDRLVQGKTKQWIRANENKFTLTPKETAFIVNNMKEVQNMEDGYEKKVKLAEIQKMIQDKIPPELGQSIRAYMRISMLLNPKTQVRNVFGNVGIMPVNVVADVIASRVDKLIAHKTNVRTTGNIDLAQYAKGFKQGVSQSYNDFKKGINTRNMEGNRFEVTEGKSFNDAHLLGKLLNKTDNLTSFLLDGGDRGFYEGAFMNSIHNQMVLNNTDTVTQEMINIATNEALQRTWQDNNKYTKFVMDIRQGLNNIVSIKGYGLGDVLIPFAKTPANLTKAIIDYSPVGLVTSITKGKKLKNAIETGQFTAEMQHQFVQDLGKATAGTLLYVLGYALAQAGAITGSGDDDKDVKNFLKNTMGVNPYSIKIGDTSFTYDWAQPIAAPFAIMANIAQKSDEGAGLEQAILTSLDVAGNVLFEQSFMESINTVISNNDGIVTGLGEALLELPSRAIPTLAKQIAEMIDGTQRQSFVYDDPLQTATNKVKAKIPFMTDELAPTVNTLGDTVEKYGGDNNWFNVFFNPSTVNKEHTNEVAEEVYRLYQATGDKTIMPRQVAYYVNSNGEKINFTNEQRAEFQTISGKMTESNIRALMNSSSYNALSDTEKAEVVAKVVNYSYNKAQSEVIGTELSETYQSVSKYQDLGGTAADYYLYNHAVSNADSETKKTTAGTTLMKMSITDQQKAYLYTRHYSTEEKADLIINSEIPFDYFIQYDMQEFAADKDSEGKSISGSRKSKVISYINSLDLSIPQKAILIKATNTFKFNDYNKQVIEYVDSLGLSYDETVRILEELDMTVINGRVYWD